MTPTTNITPDPVPTPTTPPLAPEVQAVLDEVLQRVAQARMPGDPPRPQTETADEWIARFREWVNSHPKSEVIADDSRESIYD
jgi:hypothetical protein